jgi:hypothetical protein
MAHVRWCVESQHRLARHTDTHRNASFLLTTHEVCTCLYAHSVYKTLDWGTHLHLTVMFVCTQCIQNTGLGHTSSPYGNSEANSFVILQLPHLCLRNTNTVVLTLIHIRALHSMEMAPRHRNTEKLFCTSSVILTVFRISWLL